MAEYLSLLRTWATSQWNHISEVLKDKPVDLQFYSKWRRLPKMKDFRRAMWRDSTRGRPLLCKILKEVHQTEIFLHVNMDLQVCSQQWVILPRRRCWAVPGGFGLGDTTEPVQWREVRMRVHLQRTAGSPPKHTQQIIWPNAAPVPRSEPLIRGWFC